MKLQGLYFLEGKLTHQADQMLHILLYKNTPPEKRDQHTLGLGMWILQARECRDIAWCLTLIREIAEQGDTAPEEYDPYFDASSGMELDPDVDAPLPYDPYREMGVYLHDAHAPHGLHLQLSAETLRGAELLMEAPRRQHDFEVEMGERPMQRNADDPTGPFRRMTEEEHARYARQQETEYIEATLFLLDFNHDMERLGELVLARAPFAEILALIGPLPVPEPEPDMPF